MVERNVMKDDETSTGAQLVEAARTYGHTWFDTWTATLGRPALVHQVETKLCAEVWPLWADSSGWPDDPYRDLTCARFGHDVRRAAVAA